jgi:hypothetical protein
LSGVERGTESIMRAQAVAATTIAPVTAIACGIISRDGGRHREEERDHCANKGRAQRHEGDLPNNEGDAAGN